MSLTKNSIAPVTFLPVSNPEPPTTQGPDNISPERTLGLVPNPWLHIIVHQRFQNLFMTFAQLFPPGTQYNWQAHSSEERLMATIALVYGGILSLIYQRIPREEASEKTALCCSSLLAGIMVGFLSLNTHQWMGMVGSPLEPEPDNFFVRSAEILPTISRAPTAQESLLKFSSIPKRIMDHHPSHLTQMARAALVRWGQTGRDDFDYPGFIAGMSVEFGHTPEEVTTRWNRLFHRPFSQMPRDRNPFHRNRRVIQTLAVHFNIGEYLDANGYPIGYMLEPYMGNCSSRSWTIMAGLRTGHVTPPSGWEHGVQRFNRHDQVVLVHRRSGRVIDLLTGERFPTTTADVYSTLYFARAYLDSEPDQAEFLRDYPWKRFLLVPANDNSHRINTAAPSEVPTAQNRFLGYPPSRYVYSTDPNPPHAVIDLDFSDLPPTPDTRDPETILVSQLTGRNDIDDDRELFREFPGLHFLPRVNSHSYIFSDENHRRTFLSLPISARTTYLHQLLFDFFQTIDATEVFQHFSQTISVPGQAASAAEKRAFIHRVTLFLLSQIEEDRRKFILAVHMFNRLHRFTRDYGNHPLVQFHNFRISSLLHNDDTNDEMLRSYFLLGVDSTGLFGTVPRDTPNNVFRDIVITSHPNTHSSGNTLRFVPLLRFHGGDPVVETIPPESDAILTETQIPMNWERMTEYLQTSYAYNVDIFYGLTKYHWTQDYSQWLTQHPEKWLPHFRTSIHRRVFGDTLVSCFFYNEHSSEFSSMDPRDMNLFLRARRITGSHQWNVTHFDQLLHEDSRRVYQPPAHLIPVLDMLRE